MIESFNVEIPESKIIDLQDRIRNTRWPDSFDHSDWSYGVNVSYLKELSDYWLHEFNWRFVEDEINSFPNFMAEIDGYKIHFLHITGNKKKSIPLLITHGWPGSFLEMSKLIHHLTRAEDISFDLVIPSVIGFGFSSNTSHQGCDSALVADLWHKLMLELGYPHYGAQGGDIGAGISSWLSLKYPDHVIGLHLNYITGSYEPYLREDDPLEPEVLDYKKFANTWYTQEGAYAHVHQTKPTTLAVSLNDSPVGLCGWIIEKFNSWSDNKGDIENCFTKDELLANVTLYWLTQTIHSSMSIYKENVARPFKLKENEFVSVPVGFAKFPKELPTPPRSYIEKGFNIVQWTEMKEGGHFAAFEQPELLAADIVSFFKIAVVTNDYTF